MAERYVEHVTAEGERWDLLAWRYYGDAHRYEPIIRANPGVPITPVLAGGQRLRIPVLADPAPAAAALPPWKRGG